MVALVLKLVRTVVLVELLEYGLALEADALDLLRLGLAELEEPERAAAAAVRLSF